MMSRVKTAVIAGVALACTTVGASANTLTFQGLDFTMTALTSTELELTIAAHTGNSITASAAAAPGSDWIGINFLSALALKPAGGSYTGATLAGWTFENTGLNANGCAGGSNGYVCFDRSPDLAIPATGAMTFDIFFTGGTVDFGATSLKLNFAGTDGGSKIGSNLSQDITVGLPVPGPAVGAGLPGLVAACFGLFALARRRRRQFA